MECAPWVEWMYVSPRSAAAPSRRRRARAETQALPARADDDQVFLLEARPLGRAEVPVVAEGAQGRVELPLAALLLGVRPCGDRRSVLGLEVLAVILRL